MITEADIIHSEARRGSVPLKEFEDEIIRDDEDLDDISNDITTPVIQRDDSAISVNRDPNLHSMGKMFLDRYSRLVFDIAVMIHFISILISYSLAGSEAYAILFGVDHQYLISPFVIVLSLTIIFGSVALQPVISALTFGKGAVLVLMVGVIAIVGIKVSQPIHNDWRYIGSPFLLGTVALGGAVNILPVTFSKIHSKRQDIIQYIKVSTGALFVVWFLNVLWCFYILKIVPQTDGSNGISLWNSQQRGEISTVPLVEFIHQQYPEFNWIASLVDIFITVSITVSYITMGTGTKHVLDGFTHSDTVQSVIATERIFEGDSIGNRLVTKLKSLKLAWKKAFAYSLCYGLVLLIAQTNPRGFIIIMEKVTSLALNLEAGAFIAVMVGKARSFHQSIPFPLHDRLYKARYLVLGYFLFAVVYDILGMILHGFGIEI